MGVPHRHARPRHTKAALAFATYLAACPAPDAPPPSTPPTTVNPSIGDAAHALAAAPAEPELVAYGTPEVEEARVIRSGNKVNLHLRWSAVEGAPLYEAQVAKTLTFSRTVKAAEIRRPLFFAARIEPGVYFWRVRAKGPAGEGAWSALQVLDATRTGRRGARGPRLAAVNPDDEAALKTTTAAPDPELPLRLVWRTPLHQSVATRSPLVVEGVATRGTSIQLNALPPVSVTATFSLEVPLTHGRNDLHLSATLGTQTKNLTRVVFYADPSRLAPIKERFEQLRVQLDEINAIRDELNATVKSLESQLKKSGDQARVVAVKEEMLRINEIRREIDAEINRAIGDLDRLLGS